MRTKEDNYTYNWVIDTLGNWAMQCLGKRTTFFKIETKFKFPLFVSYLRLFTNKLIFKYLMNIRVDFLLSISLKTLRKSLKLRLN